MISWDIILADVEGFFDSVLWPVIEQIQKKWYPEDVDDKLPRCGTAHIRNNEDGNGEIRIVLRFPLDMEALQQVEDERTAEVGRVLGHLSRRTRLHVVRSTDEGDGEDAS
jgi:hypothetical protein